MRNFRRAILAPLCVLGFFGNAIAEPRWDLPMTINDTNTTVTFDVDTTWHVVDGKTSNTSGSVSLSDPNNLMSIQSEIHFPVKSFDTGWSARDDSLHEHMQAEKYKDVVLKTSTLEGDCKPEMLKTGPCKGTLIATLTICDVTKELPLEVDIEAMGDKYKVTGNYSFKWADYNVEDPSILVAKVDPTVRVKYALEVPKVEK